MQRRAEQIGIESRAKRFGPGRAQSALALTIDNLGEARALERGMQPEDVPVGSDPSVTRALPWLLDELVGAS